MTYPKNKTNGAFVRRVNILTVRPYLEHKLQLKFKSISCEIALKWMPQNSVDDKSKPIQVMAWCTP